MVYGESPLQDLGRSTAKRARPNTPSAAIRPPDGVATALDTPGLLTDTRQDVAMIA